MLLLVLRMAWLMFYLKIVTGLPYSYIWHAYIKLCSAAEYLITKGAAKIEMLLTLNAKYYYFGKIPNPYESENEKYWSFWKHFLHRCAQKLFAPFQLLWQFLSWAESFLLSWQGETIHKFLFVCRCSCRCPCLLLYISCASPFTKLFAYN